MSPSGTKRVTFSRYYRYDNDDVTSCAISGDGYVVVSTSWYNNLKVWDATSGIERLTLSGHTDMVTNCVISGDGRVIVSASKDRTLKVWDAITGVCLLTFPVDDNLRGCAFHPDGKHLVACGDLGMSFLQLVR